ncbi:hypothetical protein P3W45_000909 [Vairimorpha bombi]|jgi:hypothetical protein
MRKSVLIGMYSFFILYSIILEIINTKNILDLIVKLGINKKEELTFKYHLIYTKILIILDTFYYYSFYIRKRINEVVQLIVIKLLYIVILLGIALRLEFSASFIISFILQGLSGIFVWYSFQTENSSIYAKYNHNISSDLNIINLYIVKELIFSLKLTTSMFLYLLIIADLASGIRNMYRILSPLKIAAFLVDVALQKNKLSFYALNLTSVIMFGILNAYGIYYVIMLFVRKEALNNEISVFIEILSLITILLNLYYMYLKKLNK